MCLCDGENIYVCEKRMSLREGQNEIWPVRLIVVNYKVTLLTVPDSLTICSIS